MEVTDSLNRQVTLNVRRDGAGRANTKVVTDSRKHKLEISNFGGMELVYREIHPVPLSARIGFSRGSSSVVQGKLQSRIDRALFYSLL